MARWVAWFVGLLVVLAPAAPALGADKRPGKVKADDVFDPHKLHIVHIVLTPEAYRQMTPGSGPQTPRWLARIAAVSATRPSTRPAHPIDQKVMELAASEKTAASASGNAYARGKFVFDGREYGDVGVRWKGASSLSLARGTLKKPIKINFDCFREDQKFYGLDELSFSNNALDPSMIRESLSYWAFRNAGLPAPRTTFALVYLTVEGQLERKCLGVYTMIEEVDGEFLKSRFGGKDGLLLKPEGAHDLTYRGPGWNNYGGYDAKTDGSPQLRQRLIDFLWLIQQSDAQTFNREIGGFIDVDAFLRFLALNVLLSNMDSFLATGHNFYLHIDPHSGKISFIPWDHNLSMAGYLRMGSGDELMDLSLRKPYVGRGTLIKRLLAAPGMEERYLNHIRALSREFFNAESLSLQIGAMEKAVAEGQRLAREFSPDGPAAPPTFIWWKAPPTPAKFVAKRLQSVQEQLEGRSQGYVPRYRRGALLDGRPARAANPPAFGGALFKWLDNDLSQKLLEDEVAQPALEQFDRALARHPDKKSLDQEMLTQMLEGLLQRPNGKAARLRGESAGAVLARTLLHEADRDKDSFLTRVELELGLRRLLNDADFDDDGTLSEKEFLEGLAKLFDSVRF